MAGFCRGRLPLPWAQRAKPLRFWLPISHPSHSPASGPYASAIWSLMVFSICDTRPDNFPIPRPAFHQAMIPIIRRSTAAVYTSQSGSRLVGFCAGSVLEEVESVVEADVHHRSGEDAIAKLGSIEDRLVKCVNSGEILDLTNADESASSASVTAWGNERTIRANVVRDILRGKLAAMPDPLGLRVRAQSSMTTGSAIPRFNDSARTGGMSFCPPALIFTAVGPFVRWSVRSDLHLPSGRREMEIA